MGGANPGKFAAAGGGVAPGATGKATRGRGRRGGGAAVGRGGRGPRVQRQAAGGGRSRARGARRERGGPAWGDRRSAGR